MGDGVVIEEYDCADCGGSGYVDNPLWRDDRDSVGMVCSTCKGGGVVNNDDYYNADAGHNIFMRLHDKLGEDQKRYHKDAERILWYCGRQEEVSHICDCDENRGRECRHPENYRSGGCNICKYEDD